MRRTAVFLLFVVLSSLLAGAGSPELPVRDRRWLDEDVRDLITDYERQAFLSLTSQRDRSEFIGSFWDARDLRPDTLRNERRTELLERSQEAQRRFRDGSVSGDPRGRIHVQLGAPTERTLYWSGTVGGAVAVEDWRYDEGDATLGLPRLFHVLFVRPSPTEPFTLYEPMTAGPELLVEALLGAAPASRGAALEALGKLSAELAALSLSLIAAEPADLARGAASPGSAVLIEVLNDLRNRLPVDVSYVSRVLAAAAATEDVAGAEAIPVAAHFQGAFSTATEGQLHFVLEVPPGLPTVREQGGRYEGAMRVRGRLYAADAGAGRAVAVAYIDEPVSVSLSAADLARVGRFPFAIEEVMPMIPGAYRATFVVHDEGSDRYGAVDASFVVPAVDSAPLQLGPPMVVSREVTAGNEVRPYAFDGGVFYPSLGARIAPIDECRFGFQLRYDPERIAAGTPLTLRYEVRSQDDTPIGGFDRVTVDPERDGGVAFVRIKTSPRGLPPGPYTLWLSVSADNAGTEMSAETTLGIEVVPEVSRASPVVYVRKRPRGPALDAMLVVSQRLASGSLEGAVAPLELAVASPVVGLEARFILADQLLALGRPGEVAALLGNLVTAPAATRVPALVRLGVAAGAAGDGVAAVDALSAAAALAPRSTAILNRLAEVALASGVRDVAVDALKRSLEVTPDQREVASRLSQLQRQGR